MKRGFTLAETLITLLIIGVVTMLVLPAVIKSKPDEAKVEYLKTEKTLAHIIKNLAKDTRRYPSCMDIGGTTECFRDYPLFNNTAGVNNAVRHANQGKLCVLVAEAFGIDNPNCNPNPAADYTNATPQAWSFRTNEGKAFYIGEHRSKADYYAEIVFDLNRQDKQNCLYDAANNCTNPGRFKLWVTADGEVHPGDSMGDAYIKSSKSWLRREYQPQAMTPRTPVPVIYDRGCKRDGDCGANSHCDIAGECQCDAGFQKETDGSCQKCLKAQRTQCEANGIDYTFDENDCSCNYTPPVPEPEPQREEKKPECPDGFTMWRGKCTISCGETTDGYRINCIDYTYNRPNSARSSMFNSKCGSSSEYSPVMVVNKMVSQVSESDSYTVYNGESIEGKATFPVTVPIKLIGSHGHDWLTLKLYSSKNSKGVYYKGYYYPFEWLETLKTRNAAGLDYSPGSNPSYKNLSSEKIVYTTECTIAPGNNSCTASASGDKLASSNFESEARTALFDFRDFAGGYGKDIRACAVTLRPSNAIYKVSVNNGSPTVFNQTSSYITYYKKYVDEQNKIIYLFNPPSPITPDVLNRASEL